ncbi:MAG TPA: mercuric reductase, partial [Chloroflexota bacterium]|nr:mercuric reductase [Chloroflexota bacterium]
MPETEHYDAVIIGSGQAAGPLSTALSKAGRRTALIEREHIGGTCINEGCTPTKTMVASARVAYMARRAGEYGVEDGAVGVYMSQVRTRKRRIVEEFRLGSLSAIESGEVDVLMGEASFTGPRSVRVKMIDGAERRLEAEVVVIDTGSRPVTPRIPGLDSVPTLNSTTVMDLDVLPDHLLILGGGYVGVEFAQLFRRFGSRVTIMQNGPALLTREDPDVSAAVAGILREDGVQVLLEAQADHVQPGQTAAIEISVKTPEGEMWVQGSHLLVATGRRPNVEALDLEKAGISTTERGVIRVDQRLATDVPGVYAAGEVAGSPAFTHIAYDDFRILRDNLVDGKERTTKGRLVPYTVFIDPQLGRVGLTEAEARAEGLDIAVARLPMSSVARAEEVGETRGAMKVVIDRATRTILGCAILGIEGGELMAMVEIAMMGGLPYTAL